jgi:hypothetical protein
MDLRKKRKQTQPTPRPIPTFSPQRPTSASAPPALSLSLADRWAPPVRVTPNLQPIPFPSSASHQAAAAGQILAPLGLSTFNQCHQSAVKPPFTSPPSILPVTPSRARPLDGNQGHRPPWPSMAIASAAASPSLPLSVKPKLESLHLLFRIRLNPASLHPRVCAAAQRISGRRPLLAAEAFRRRWSTPNSSPFFSFTCNAHSSSNLCPRTAPPRHWTETRTERRRRLLPPDADVDLRRRHFPSAQAVSNSLPWW